jgi:bifunctional non-homologous end joining protein LigD
VHERLERLKTDPWADFDRSRQTLTASIKKQLGMGTKRRT